MVSYFGCASSSNSIRYSEHNQETENKSPTPRYGENQTTANDTEDLPADEKSIDISSLTNDESLRNSSVREKVLMEVVRYLNTPYVYGGDSKSGIDCSAFTQRIYSDCLSYNLPRTTVEQYSEGTEISRIKNLKFGDLVFFDTRRLTKPGHVGIYLGDGLFAHASSSKGVIVSSIKSDYYLSRFMGARRIESFASKDSSSR